ncbi:hypothetical protein GGX14DRAFT_578084 [Mycena pura]|uniref:Uncharacterized protein n=1 Tax=Mycena pura TaxID=153505 RepID=A0AAD6UQG8_9AGAR|nr:hypothetical protein GGX14DRAFT_578084 [Mycena pura]
MPAARTEKESKRHQRTKARSSAQLTNCFGSSRRVLVTTSRQCIQEKENVPTSPASSQLPTSPYSRTSGLTSPLTRSADAFLALQQRIRKEELEIYVQALQEQLSGLEKSSSAFGASLRRQLDELSAELIQQKRDVLELRARYEELARKKQALSKKVARFDGRFATGVARLSTQSLKEDGIISTEIRACVRDIVSLGAPTESVDKIIHAVAKGLNIQICDHISTRSTGRIVIEGGVAAQLQIVDAIKNADHFTASGDGTSHKHLNYESRFITVKQNLLALGLTQAPSHTSEEQMAGWLKLIEEMYTAYNDSPLGRAYPEDFRTFFIKITGMMTDHAAAQKSERALLCQTVPRLLDVIYEITDTKIRAAGGMAAWDALAAEERDHRNSTLYAELCQKFGQAEFDKLSKGERDEADFFHCGGCFMHKDLNAHKGGVESMMAAWLKHGFEQPILLMNKDNAAAANSGSAVARERAETVLSSDMQGKA